MTPEPRPSAQHLRADLPVLSPSAARILQACEDPDIDFATLAACLGEAPGIAARLLGLANSAFYCHGRPIHSLANAIQIIGLVTARGIAVGLLIGDHFSPARCPAFDAARFWQSAVLTAQLAQLLAPAVPPDRALPREAAYMAGLLHNIGLLALVSQQPDEMNALLPVAAGEPAVPLCQRLRARLGFDQHQMAGWLAADWRLPAELCRVMEHCGEPDYRGEAQALVQLTDVCVRCVRDIIATGSAPAAIDASGLANLGLDATQVAQSVDRLCAALATLRAAAGAFLESEKTHAKD